MNNTNQPLRVLHVVTSMNRGGLETMIMNYYRHIDRQRVQFDFLVHRDERADYDDEIESLCGNIYRIPRLVPWSIRYRKSLNSFFDSHPEYSIVHVHQDCLSSIALKTAKKHGVPVRIAHSHSTNIDKNIKYFIKIIYRRFITKYATKLMACSEAAGKWMFCCKDSSKFTILPNAVDAKKFDFNTQLRTDLRKELGISQNDFVLGHIGRFAPEKKHEFIIDIFNLFLKSNPNARLVLVGDGELRNAIEKKVANLGLTEYVRFTGTVSNVSHFLQVMDAFVFPSKYEGLGIALIEAQTSGLPCVISESLPNECVICSDLISRISINDSAKKWVECILGFSNSSRKGRSDDIVSAGYDINECAKKLEEFYLES